MLKSQKVVNAFSKGFRGVMANRKMHTCRGKETQPYAYGKTNKTNEML